MVKKATKKKIESTEKKVESFEEALTRTEQFIEDNQKILTIIVGVIVVIVVGFTFFKKMVVLPKYKEALSQMYVAEDYFEKDSFNLALNGDGNNLGFLDIIDQYKITKAANLAKYYAGISYLHLGQYDDAIDYLSHFHSSDLMVSVVALGAVGDAYMQLDNKEKALEYYLKAANKSKADFVTPIYLMKAGEVMENLKQYDKALEAYTEIKNKYPKSDESRNIDKYITRVKLSKELAATEK